MASRSLRSNRRIVRLLGALTLGASTLDAQGVTDRVGWLAGCWEARDGARTTFEMWSPPQGGLLVGAGRTVADGRARAHEHLRLRQAGDTLIYTALPSGQAETEFRSTTVTDSSFTVENLAHDFPQRLVYTRLGADSISARVEGPGPNSTRGFTLRFARTACTGGAARAAAFVDSLRNALGIPAMSATVIDDGQVALSRGFGLANITAATPATPETRFRVGSVSKLFTAVALMRLVEQGRVDLDAPLRSYLTPYPASWPDVTLRQLAGHSAGVRHYGDDEFFSQSEYATLRDAMGIFDADTLRFAPGTRYGYSSYGYNTIGAAMEAVTGEDFPVLMQRLVFEPLGMTHTVVDSVGRPMPARATLYDIGDSEVEPARADNLSSRWPSGGYLSSTADLARFGRAVLAPGFLSQESLTTMLTPQILTGGDTTTVGIGWRIGIDDAGRRYFHHGGTSNGGSAFLLVFPDENLIVAMAANAYARWSTPQALRVASEFR